MLDTETKRRIDSARDILVGKVPDPKAQVEQITTALVYKFMDDMDKESIELGGKAQFFKNGYAQYAWSKLMDPRVGGHERLALYGEAITKMAENPNIPQLFRNIFKDAFLPYRDPETLNLFLKEINGFVYDHSERLGDAYEYLLSVLGSQGDAGQFRTPRHIIDFIVKVVDPDKSETILDPACGTAGFLISAFKHILGKYQKNKPGDLMTPAERKKFMGNFAGYEISPDMVKIALVNLYLHSFPNPSIVEYDTLTSEEKWDELYDVILANPPFMSPKGGIRPHKRFSVQATRSEVLFVDYIMEHLTKDGRAGVIVPEGVIFQGQTAYKELRRKLVEENYLWAVISLPSGLFNPYSGVKTSILLIDKRIAKQTNDILFVKIENDGFDLGAQRKEIDKNDLPEAQSVLKSGNRSKISHKVRKNVILSDAEIVLAGDRYLSFKDKKSNKWPIVELDNISHPEYGFTASAQTKGDARFIRITDIDENGELKPTGAAFINISSESKRYLLKKGDLLVARTGATFGKTLLYNLNSPAIFASYLIRLNLDADKILPEYYWAFAQSEKYWEQARRLMTGGGQPQFNGGAIKKIQVALPPISIQKKIVNELNTYQNQIAKKNSEIAELKGCINSRLSEIWGER